MVVSRDVAGFVISARSFRLGTQPVRSRASGNFSSQPIRANGLSCRFAALPKQPGAPNAQKGSFASSKPALRIPLLRRMGPPTGAGRLARTVIIGIPNGVSTSRQIAQTRPHHTTPALALSTMLSPTRCESGESTGDSKRRFLLVDPFEIHCKTTKFTRCPTGGQVGIPLPG
jgi:hypothetical protein